MICKRCQVEDHLYENLRDNMLGPMTLATLCSRMGVHLTYFGTRCWIQTNV